MAINIQNIIAALEAKVAAATSSTETQELIVIIKSIKAAGQQTIVTYANVAVLPAASAENAGNLAYVADVGKIYYSNATTWTEVGSGGGSSFDQSLNTTDDVVFNSALVGDVNIIGNTIAGVDSYGNADTLVVDGGLNVQFGELSTTTRTISLNAYGGSNSFYFNNDNGTFAVQGSYLNGTETVSTDMPSGSLVTLSANYGDVVIRLTSAFAFNGSSWIATAILISGSNAVMNMGNAAYSFTPITVTSTIDTQVNVLEVTETSVNVNGALTVNGQPLSTGGSSFDQSLNTTDDVVFNSALVGDVNIIGNTIAGVDSYGNADTLVVDGGLTVAFDTTVLAPTIVRAISTQGGFWTYVGNQGYEGHIDLTQNNGANPAAISTLLTLTPGTVVQMNQLQYGMFGSGSGYFVVAGVQDVPGFGGMGLTARIIISEFNLPHIGSGVMSSNVSLFNIDFSWDGFAETGSLFNVLEVTQAGVNVNGDLTVNGQPLSGSGSSYDQSLNTTDDVVFNSALVGDVSIVGDTISAVDSYGLSKDLIVDSKIITPALDVRVYTDNSVNYEAVNSYGMSPDIQNYPWQRSLTIYNYGGTENSAVIAALAAQANTGNRINFAFNTVYGLSTGYMKVDFVSGGGNGSAFYLNEFVVTYGFDYYYTGTSLFGATFTIGEIVESLPLSVTETGVNVNGEFTLNGQPLSTGGSSFDQDLNTTNDVVFNSALIGDVSIVGNTLSAIDSYGNADTLVVDGKFSVIKPGEFIPYQFTYDGVNVGQVFYYTNTGLVYIEKSLISTNQQDESNLLSMKVGDIFVFDNPSYQQTTLTLTSNFSLDTTSGYGGPEGVYIATVDKLNPFGSYATPSQYVLANIKSAEITSLSVTESGVAINGDLTLVDNSATPTNTSTVVKWAKIIVGGQVYYTPLYQ